MKLTLYLRRAGAVEVEEGFGVGGGTSCICSCSIAADASRSPTWFSAASVAIGGAVGEVELSAAPCWAAISPNEGEIVAADPDASVEI